MNKIKKALIGLVCAIGTLSAEERPNIIYILADDLGYGDLGCYGQEVLETPNIDRLAAEGMRFTQHYAGNTVCAPSRSALLEGKHTGRTMVRGNIPYHLMDSDAPTLGKLMKQAGYATACIGKWGVGHLPPLDDPEIHGFEHFYGYVNMWHAHNFYPEYLYRNGEKDYLEGNVLDERIKFDRQPKGSGVAKEKEVFAPYELERETLEYLKQERDRPFFLYLALNQPHNNGEYGRIYGDGGYEVPGYREYTNRDWPRSEKGFATNISIIDDIVGNILDTLESQGIAENTIVMFSSDNGACQGAGHSYKFFKSTGGLRGYKRDLYEGGIRVPFIAKWPGKVTEGSESEHISASWDLLPTFCEIAGVDAPSDIDGISMLPALTEEGEQEQHKYLYWEFYSKGGRQALRKRDWKAVKLHVIDEEPEVFELYNLAEDLFETNDLSGDYPEIAKEMKLLMAEAHEPHDVMKLYPDE
ncbi:MAG: arylsulfatase [Opitutales bacterium]|nr:arylsulfatase [Opitutales bacterium]